MKRLAGICVAMAALGAAGIGDPVRFADPFVGTDNTKEVSNGNLYPAIARPWGMNAWTPQTGPAGERSASH